MSASGDPASADEPALWRLFIAVFPPPAWLDALAPIDRWLARAGTHRLITPEQRHVTLAFLGDVRRELCGPLVEALDDAGAALTPITLDPTGVVALPSPRSPRVIALGLAGDGFAALREGVLEAAALVAPTDPVVRDLSRPAMAHLTLARSRNPRTARRLNFARAPRLDAPGPVRIDRARLIRSTLTPSGPIYQTLSESRLLRPEPEPGPNTSRNTP